MNDNPADLGKLLGRGIPLSGELSGRGGISAISKPKSLRTASCRVDRRTHPVREHKAIHVWPNRIRQVFNDTDRTYFKKDRERALNDFPNSGLTPEQQKKITKKQIEFSSNHPRKKRA